MNLAKIRKQLDDAQANYLAVVHKETVAKVTKAGDRVKQLRAQFAAAIVEGANPCPDCGNAPHGIEQPRERGGVEYEVGCLHCGPFRHKDGTMREHRVRGGLLPKHAVEAWNAGPDHWLQKK